MPHINLHERLKNHKNKKTAAYPTKLEGCSENTIVCFSMKIPSETIIGKGPHPYIITINNLYIP